MTDVWGGPANGVQWVRTQTLVIQPTDPETGEEVGTGYAIPVDTRGGALYVRDVNDGTITFKVTGPEVARLRQDDLASRIRMVEREDDLEAENAELRAALKLARQENGKLGERIHELRMALEAERVQGWWYRARATKAERQVEKLLRRVSKEQSRADKTKRVQARTLAWPNRPHYTDGQALDLNYGPPKNTDEGEGRQ